MNVVAAGTEDQEEEATMVREVAATMDLVVVVAMEEVVSAIDVCLCVEIPSKISRQRLFN